ALLGGLLLVCAWQLRSRLRGSPGATALVVFVATAVAGFAPRGRSMELRYFEPVTVLLAFALMLAAVQVLAQRSWREPLAALTLALSAAWWLVWTPWADAAHWRVYYGVDPDRVALRDLYRQVDARFGHGQPVV